MTAHAMAGDEQKSLEAGMNDHVTKPIDPDQLFNTLLKWIKPAAAKIVRPTPPAHAGADEPDPTWSDEAGLPEFLPGFDLADGLKRLRGNQKLYRKLLSDFAADYSQVPQEIVAVLDAGKYDQAGRLVHNLKGLAGNLGAGQLQVAAGNLEKLLKGIDPKTASPAALDSRFSEFADALKQALESARSLGTSVKGSSGRIAADELSDIPAELSRDIARRIHDAAEMGDVVALNAIAGEIGDKSGSCAQLSQQIIRMAEDFDLSGIQELAKSLEMS